MSEFHFKKLSEGRYQVWAHTGHLLGEVSKHERRFELRRRYVQRYWIARTKSGARLGEYRTRSVASAALRDAH